MFHIEKTNLDGLILEELQLILLITSYNDCSDLSNRPIKPRQFFFSILEFDEYRLKSEKTIFFTESHLLELKNNFCILR